MRSATARTRCGRLAILAVLTWAGVAMAAAPAWAHDELLASDPVPGAALDVAPEQASFTYSAPVAAEFTEAGVTPPGGQRIPLGVQQLQIEGAVVTVPVGSLAPDAQPGEWTLVLRVVSGDGHPVESTLTFTTTTARPATTAASSAAVTAQPTARPSPAAQLATAQPRTQDAPGSEAPSSISVAPSSASDDGWSTGTTAAVVIGVAVLAGGAGAFALARRG